jgi:hypothetical protein
MIQIVFAVCMVALVAIGFNCARNLTADNPLWVRIIVLAPCFTALITLGALIKGTYVAYEVDILRSVSIMLIYALVSSVVSGNSWLRIHLRNTNDQTSKE